MISDRPLLKVTAEVYEGQELSFRSESTPGKEFAPFIQAVLPEKIVFKSFRHGEIAEKELKFKIPAKKSGDAPEIEAALTFRLNRGEDDLEESPWE
jgi:hypothetical protein